MARQYTVAVASEMQSQIFSAALCRPFPNLANTSKAFEQIASSAATFRAPASSRNLSNFLASGGHRVSTMRVSSTLTAEMSKRGASEMCLEIASKLGSFRISAVNADVSTTTSKAYNFFNLLFRQGSRGRRKLPVH
jgi:hypothetical protein